MEQDKDLFQWIMQYNPSDEPYPPQPSLPTTQQPSLSYQTNMMAPQDLFQSASTNVVTESSSSSHPQYMYEERQQHYQQGPFVNDPLSQYQNQPAHLYTTIDEAHLPTLQSQTKPYYSPLPGDQPYQPNDTGHLSEEDGCHYTDSQLKMMTSKERRQIRNKISARNFRNRRKEYIASLEEEATKVKNENSQLRLEIKWVRSTMNKLQTENDQLRVKLALCHSGIKMDHNIHDIIPDSSPTSSPSPSEQLPHSQMITTSSIGMQQGRSPPSPSQRQRSSTLVQTTQQQSRSMFPSTATPTGLTDNQSGSPPPPSSSFANPLPPKFTQSAHSSNITTSYHPPDLQQPADTCINLSQRNNCPQTDLSEHSPSNQAPFYQPSIPRRQQQHDSDQPSRSHQNNNDSYVETALFPDFNYGDILSKQQNETHSSTTLQDYPLLAVALVSIVIGQAMVMTSTDSSSYLPSLSAKIEDLVEQDHPPHRNSPSNIRQPKTQVSEAIMGELVNRQPGIPAVNTEDSKADGSEETLKSVNNDGPWYNAQAAGFQAICPLYWMQRMLCKFVITYLVVKYPHLEAPFKTYLPICERFRRRVTHA